MLTASKTFTGIGSWMFVLIYIVSQSSVVYYELSKAGRWCSKQTHAFCGGVMVVEIYLNLRQIYGPFSALSSKSWSVTFVHKKFISLTHESLLATPFLFVGCTMG